ncbi:MAG: hypothetical protein H6R10_3076 [Rhodocyclaceae bacterium]|nr:hypothetical protein [Rhodocyclaceae bacterium]
MTDEIKAMLLAAIEHRRLIHLLYDGRSKTLEPYALGENEKREEIVLCRQVRPLGSPEAWQVLRLSNMYGLLVLEREFTPAEDYIDLSAKLPPGIRLEV